MSDTIDALALAEIIRKVDGNHDLGAGALADAILAALTDAGYVVVKAEDVERWRGMLEVIAAPPRTDAPYAIGVTARNVARAALATKEKP